MSDKSVLPAEMKGVMFLSGYRGIGKSYLAATADAPNNVAYLDYESKGEGLDAQLHFGMYRSLTSESAGGGVTKLWDVTSNAINDIPKGTTVCVLDNIAPLELALRAEAGRDLTRYVKEFGLNLANVQAGRYGGLSSVVNFLITEKLTAPIHAKGVRLIIAITHVKPRWENGVPIPNKFNLKGADRWQELSILSLVLHPGEHAPIPAALVQKEQLGTLMWDSEKGEHTIARRLPLRIPSCTFSEIRRYLREPADLRNPAPGEVPTDEQTDPFRAELSRDQITMMTTAMKVSEDAPSGEDMIDIAPDPRVIQAKSLLASGKNVMSIAREMSITMQEVSRLLR